MTPILHASPLDSSRFSLRVFRGNTDDVTAKRIADEIFKNSADVAIVRVPAGRGAHLSTLERYGLPTLHADTLVHYRCDLSKYSPQPLRNTDLDLSVATYEDMRELREVIHTTFKDYTSHYNANPLFPSDQVLLGYQEWAEGHFDEDNRSLWIARRAGKLVGFAACLDSPDRGEAEGVLYGIAPEQAGGGLYGDLIRHTQAVAKSMGRHTMTVSTQVTNYAVQKVWAREGFHLFEAIDTYHINALLAAGETLTDRNLVFTAEMIDKFAAVSGDNNPVHIDDNAARRAGFPGRIAHGVMSAAEVSKVLGTENPGPGTIIRQMNLSFLRPLVCNVNYKLRSKYWKSSATTGTVVSCIFDSIDNLCLIIRTGILTRQGDL